MIVNGIKSPTIGSMNSGMSINFKSSVQTWAGHCVVLFVLALAAAVVNIDGLVSQLLSCQ